MEGTAVVSVDVCFYGRVKSATVLIQVGGGGAAQRDPIPSFSHTFPPKSTRVGGWHPQRVSPQREILDQQLSVMLTKLGCMLFSFFYTFNF